MHPRALSSGSLVMLLLSCIEIAKRHHSPDLPAGRSLHLRYPGCQPEGGHGSMEHPVFSLSTKTRVKRYENGENRIEIRPGLRPSMTGIC